jgi:hypothetical protein
MTALLIKSLLTSLYQREDLYPSLTQWGKGRFSDIINPAIIVVILNPSPVTLSETKGLAVQLRTRSVKDLVTA